MEIDGRPVGTRRLVLYAGLLAVLGAAGFLLLPGGLVKIAAAGLVALPALFVAADRPKWVFYAFTILLFSNLDIFLPLHTFRYSLILTVLVLALALLRGRTLVVHDRLLYLLVAAFALAAFQSTIAARDLDAALGGFSALAKALVSVLLIAQFMRNRAEFRFGLLAIAFGVILCDFLPFVLSPPTGKANLSLMWEQGVLRYEGFAFEPNWFAFLQNATIPLLLFLFAVDRRPTRILLLAAAVGSAFLLPLSLSRGGLLALAVLLAALVVIERRNRAVLSLAIAAVIVGIVLMPAVLWERAASLFREGSRLTEDFAIMTRIETVRTAATLGARSPLFGVGISNFLEAAPRYIPYRYNVHNAPLQLFSELGLPGLIVFSAIVVRNFQLVGRLMGRRDDRQAALAGRMLCLQQIAVLANAMFIPVSYDLVMWLSLLLPAVAHFSFRPAGERCGAPGGAAA